jgi:hypothetical protein
MTSTEYPSGAGAGGTWGTGTGTGTDVAAPEREQGSGGIREQAGQTAGTAAGEGKRVAGIAGDEAQKVVGETKLQARVLMDDARNQLEEQSRSQRDRLVQTLGTLGRDLDRMAGSSESGLASDLVRGAAERVQNVRQHLDGREPAEMLDEVREFARRRPGVFLLGALAAGVVAGRVARGAQKARAESDTSATGSMAGTRGMPQQRSATSYETTGSSTMAQTPTSPAMASFPPDQPGEIS